MKQLLKLTACILLLGTVLFISCKKELACYECKENKPPLANAGADQTITLPKDSVLLDGSASTDTDGTITSYKWAKIAGPTSSNIINSDSSRTTVKALVAGVYQFELTVRDNGGLTAKDTLRVMVDTPGNQAPVACAGADQTITLPANTVNLDGSCSADPDNNITAYEWTKTSGPAVTIVNANKAQTQVTGLVQGIYQFELKVTDARGLFSKDWVQVTVDAVICDVSSRPTLSASLTQIGTLSEARTPQAGAVGNKIVFAGGDRVQGSTEVASISSTNSSAVDIYDINTHVWTTAKLSTGRSNMAVVTAGNKIFFAGGYRHEDRDDGYSYAFPVDNVDIYDASTNTWSVAHLSKPRDLISAATIGNKVIFAGGQSSDVVDIFDISTGKWSASKLSGQKMSPTPVVIGNKVYFAGGFPTINTTDIYDSSTDTWSTSTLPEDIALAGAYQLGNYLVWGHQKPVKIKNMSSGAIITNCVSGGVFSIPGLKNDGIVFFTGSDKSNNALKSFDFYNPLTGIWYVGMLNQSFPGTASAGIITVNSTIYVGGGAFFTSPGSSYSNKVYTLNW